MASTAATLTTVELDPDERSSHPNGSVASRTSSCSPATGAITFPNARPFELLFFDGGRFDQAPDAIDLVATGGLIVKDDLSPDWEGPDPVRELLSTIPNWLQPMCCSRGRRPPSLRSGSKQRTREARGPAVALA
ncbi:MAG: hypothetical protein M3O92_03625 [Actinomycetota bacterium]|nr:hypothetical protein [Actinomycetota bacterium]